MGTSALSLKLRWRGFWWTISKRVQILLVLLVVAGVVSATGALLGAITRTQVVSEIGISTTPDAFPGAFLGVSFPFTVTLTNPSGTPLVAHVGIVANSCPSVGVATVVGTFSTANVCTGTPAESNSATILAGGSANFAFSVVYTGAAGTYGLTIQAHAGAPS